MKMLNVDLLKVPTKYNLLQEIEEISIEVYDQRISFY